MDAHQQALPPGDSARECVVLVEGASDRVAVEVLAERRGQDLAAAGVTVVSMGGATNIGRFLSRLDPAPPGRGPRVAGLCDVGEIGFLSRGLERAGLGSDLGRDEMESLGFFVCAADLEDELIRALGVTGVERVIEAQGELGSLRILRQQPAQQGRSAEQQLRRFMGTRSGRKTHYARVLVEALNLGDVPRPLEKLLEFIQVRRGVTELGVAERRLSALSSGSCAEVRPPERGPRRSCQREEDAGGGRAG